MNRAENMGSKQFQVKSGHRAEMDWEENMGSKEISKNKRRHRGKMNGTEKNGKQRVPSEKRSSYKNGLGRKNGKRIDPNRKGHLRTTNGTEKMGSKRPKKKGGAKKNHWDQNNGKQTVPSETLASYNDGLGPKHGKQKKHRRNWHPKKQRIGAKTWEAKIST